MNEYRIKFHSLNDWPGLSSEFDMTRRFKNTQTGYYGKGGHFYKNSEDIGFNLSK